MLLEAFVALIINFNITCKNVLDLRNNSSVTPAKTLGLHRMRQKQIYS